MYRTSFVIHFFARSRDTIKYRWHRQRKHQRIGYAHTLVVVECDLHAGALGLRWKVRRIIIVSFVLIDISVFITILPH